jgi:tetratricopeptide (TPR) repeat protein
VLAAVRDTEVRPGDPLALLLADLAHERLAARAPLGTLSAGESAALLDHLLARGATTAVATPTPQESAMRQHILERSDGVPLYLVSCAEGWRAAGDDPAGSRAAVDALGVPLTLAQSIHLRVLALPALPRQVLEVAALVGRVASRILLAAVLEPLGFATEHLVLALEAASAAGLLVEDGPAAHVFAHDLIREALVAEMSAARRQALHRRVARALEQVHAASLDAVSGQIATHYTQGDEPGKAIPYLERAGDHARSLYANAEAEGYYRDLVGRLDAPGQTALTARAREKLGSVLADVARFEEARQVLERAVDAYRASDDREGVLSVSARLGQVYGAIGAATDGIGRLQHVLREVGASQPSPGLAALYATLADLYYVCDRYNEQLLAAERAAQVARAIEDGRVLAAAEKERGLALLNLGRVADARKVLEEAVTLAEAASDLLTLCVALRGLSVVHVARGEFDQGYRTANRALECAQLIGAPTVLALMAQRRSTVAYFMGQWDQSHADAERATALLDQIGPSLARLYPLLILGKLSLAQGQIEAAQAQLQEAIALAERSGNLYGLRAAHSTLAERDLLEGDPATARTRLDPLLDRPGQQEGDVTALLALLAWAYGDLGDERRAEELLAESQARAAPEHMLATLVDTLRVRALLALRHHRWPVAEGALAESLALAQSMSYPYAEAKALYTFGLLHLQRGEPEQARARLEAALTVLNQLGEGLYAAHVERALSALDQRSA